MGCPGASLGGARAVGTESCLGYIRVLAPSAGDENGCTAFHLSVELRTTQKVLASSGLGIVRVILIDPDNTVFVTNEQGDPAISEEQICGGHADLVWVFPKDD